jgi:hypothetical protein
MRSALGILLVSVSCGFGQSASPPPATVDLNLQLASKLLAVEKVVEADTKDKSNGYAKFGDAKVLREALLSRDASLQRVLHDEATKSPFILPYIQGNLIEFKWLAVSEPLEAASCLKFLNQRDEASKKFPNVIYADSPASEEARLESFRSLMALSDKGGDLSEDDIFLLMNQTRSIAWDEISTAKLHSYLRRFEIFAKQVQTNCSSLGQTITIKPKKKGKPYPLFKVKDGPLAKELFNDADAAATLLKIEDAEKVPEIVAVVQRWNTIVGLVKPLADKETWSSRIEKLQNELNDAVKDLENIGNDRILGISSLGLKETASLLNIELNDLRRMALAIEQSENRRIALTTALNGSISDLQTHFGAYASRQSPPTAKTWAAILEDDWNKVLHAGEDLARLDFVVDNVIEDFSVRVLTAKNLISANRQPLLQWIEHVVHCRAGLSLFAWEESKGAGTRVVSPSSLQESVFRKRLSNPRDYTLISLMDLRNLYESEVEFSPNTLREQVNLLPSAADRNKPLFIITSNIRLTGNWKLGPTFEGTQPNPTFQSIFLLALECTIDPSLSIHCDQNTAFECAAFSMPPPGSRANSPDFVPTQGGQLPQIITVSSANTPAGSVNFIVESASYAFVANVLGGNFTLHKEQELLSWTAARSFRDEYSKFCSGLAQRFEEDKQHLNVEEPELNPEPYLNLSKSALALLKPTFPGSTDRTTLQTAREFLKSPRLLSVPGSEGEIFVMQRGITENGVPKVQLVPDSFTFSRGLKLGEAHSEGENVVYRSNPIHISPLTGERLVAQRKATEIWFGRTIAAPGAASLKVEIDDDGIADARREFDKEGMKLEKDGDDYTISFTADGRLFESLFRTLYVGKPSLVLPVKITDPKAAAATKRIQLPFSLKRCLPSGDADVTELIRKGILLKSVREDIIYRRSPVLLEDLEWGGPDKDLVYVIDLHQIERLSMRSPNNISLPVDVTLSTIGTQRSNNGQNWEPCLPVPEAKSIQGLKTLASRSHYNESEFRFLSPPQRMRVLVNLVSFSDGGPRIASTLTFEFNNGRVDFENLAARVEEQTGKLAVKEQ